MFVGANIGHLMASSSHDLEWCSRILYSLNDIR